MRDGVFGGVGELAVQTGTRHEMDDTAKCSNGPA
jgi:hypothetical protein